MKVAINESFVINLYFYFLENITSQRSISHFLLIFGENITSQWKISSRSQSIQPIFDIFWSFCLLIEGFGEQRTLLLFFLDSRSRFIVFLLLLEHIKVRFHVFQLEKEPLLEPSPLPVKGAKRITSLFILFHCTMYDVDLS